MEVEKAIDLLKRLRIATATSYIDGHRTLEPLTMGIEALEKQIPKEVKREDYNPSKCPTCGHELSEHLGDGYYKHYSHVKRCPQCWQLLSWV